MGQYHMSILFNCYVSLCLLLVGQVQSRQCIEDVIRFAAEEHLFLMADEVTVTSCFFLSNYTIQAIGLLTFSVLLAFATTL